MVVREDGRSDAQNSITHVKSIHVSIGIECLSAILRYNYEQKKSLE